MRTQPQPLTHRWRLAFEILPEQIPILPTKRFVTQYRIECVYYMNKKKKK